MTHPTPKLIRREFAKHQDLTAAQIHAAVGISMYRSREILKQMHQKGEVYIAAWYRPIGQTHRIPVYRFGQGKDVPRPPILSNREVKRRYNLRHRKKQQAA